MSIVPKACCAAVIMVVAATIGCAESDRPPIAGTGRSPAALGTVAPGPAKQLRVGPCDTEGETATCIVETGRIGNVVNCFRGEQSCWSGTWSTCGETNEASSDDELDNSGGSRNESDSNTGNAANHPNAGGNGAADAGRGNNSSGKANANANKSKNAHPADDEH